MSRGSTQEGGHCRAQKVMETVAASRKNRRTGTVLIMVESGLEKDPQSLSSVKETRPQDRSRDMGTEV